MRVCTLFACYCFKFQIASTGQALYIATGYHNSTWKSPLSERIGCPKLQNRTWETLWLAVKFDSPRNWPSCDIVKEPQEIPLSTFMDVIPPSSLTFQTQLLSRKLSHRTWTWIIGRQAFPMKDCCVFGYELLVLVGGPCKGNFLLQKNTTTFSETAPTKKVPANGKKQRKKTMEKNNLNWPTSLTFKTL